MPFLQFLKESSHLCFVVSSVWDTLSWWNSSISWGVASMPRFQAPSPITHVSLCILLCHSYLHSRLSSFLVILLYCLLFHMEHSHSYSPRMMMFTAQYILREYLLNQWMGSTYEMSMESICFILPGRTLIFSNNDRCASYQLLPYTLSLVSSALPTLIHYLRCLWGVGAAIFLYVHRLGNRDTVVGQLAQWHVGRA